METVASTETIIAYLHTPKLSTITGGQISVSPDNTDSQKAVVIEATTGDGLLGDIASSIRSIPVVGTIIKTIDFFDDATEWTKSKIFQPIKRFFGHGLELGDNEYSDTINDYYE